MLHPQPGLSVHIQDQGGDGRVQDELVHCLLVLLCPRLFVQVRESHAVDEYLSANSRKADRQTDCVSLLINIIKG